MREKTFNILGEGREDFSSILDKSYKSLYRGDNIIL